MSTASTRMGYATSFPSLADELEAKPDAWVCTLLSVVVSSEILCSYTIFSKYISACPVHVTRLRKSLQVQKAVFGDLPIRAVTCWIRFFISTFSKQASNILFSGVHVCLQFHPLSFPYPILKLLTDHYQTSTFCLYQFTWLTSRIASETATWRFYYIIISTERLCES